MIIFFSIKVFNLNILYFSTRGNEKNCYSIYAALHHASFHSVWRFSESSVILLLVSEKKLCCCVYVPPESADFFSGFCRYLLICCYFLVCELK